MQESEMVKPQRPFSPQFLTMRFHLAASASLLLLAAQSMAVWVTWTLYDSITCSDSIEVVGLDLLNSSCESDPDYGLSSMTTCTATQHAELRFSTTNCSGPSTPDDIKVVGACSEGEISEGALEGASRLSGCSSTGPMSDAASVSVEHVFSYYSDASCTQLKFIRAFPSGACNLGRKYRAVGNQLYIDVYTGSPSTACNSLDSTRADVATIGQCIAVPDDLDLFHEGESVGGYVAVTLAGGQTFGSVFAAAGMSSSAHAISAFNVALLAITTAAVLVL
eukprot:TRINITY_DN9105_c0_g2_i1.p1 TRINITY_DN9105_c0_g2~~TRINITY_DN9105_c0_g2_i1.p1  ORF type:complete len:278 (+),score=28.29 TRINITY_DN9105_c0_g2_i1:76-909(+)